MDLQCTLYRNQADVYPLAHDANCYLLQEQMVHLTLLCFAAAAVLGQGLSVYCNKYVNSVHVHII